MHICTATIYLSLKSSPRGTNADSPRGTNDSIKTLNHQQVLNGLFN